MSLTLSRPDLISLAAGFTDSSTLPVGETKELINKILHSKKRGRDALQYGTGLGDPKLRQLTSEKLCRLDHVSKKSHPHNASRVMITNGSQQLLYLITQALCDPGDIVLLEDPTYFVYLSILQSGGITPRGVPIEADGINLNQLESLLQNLKASGDLKRVKMLYLVSYYQNPSGVTTSIEKKRQVLELLKRYESHAGHSIYLLEDAAYRELGFTGTPAPSALTLTGTEDRVIYTGTYSKPFATGIRVGYGILPEPLFTTVERLKGNHDFGTSNIIQQILIEALSGETYQNHLVKLASRYRRKSKTMTSAMAQQFPSNVTWQQPEGGLYVWPSTPRRVATGMKSKLFNQALSHKVLYVPGQLCYADDPARRKPNCEMRISFGGASLKDIERGIERLGDSLKGLC